MQTAALFSQFLLAKQPKKGPMGTAEQRWQAFCPCVEVDMAGPAWYTVGIGGDR
jgi:hypothetical protein